MRLLVAAHDLYPDPGSGGTGRYVYETSRRLADRGHDVTVLTRRRGEVPTKETIEGVEVRRYDLSIADEHGLAIARQLPAAVREVREHVEATERPDVVSFQATVTEPLVDLLVPDRVPRSATFHSPWPLEYAIKAEQREDAGLREAWNASLRRRIERRILARSEQVLALSRFMAGKLHETHDALVDVDIVPGGVDPQTFTPEAGPSARLASGEPAFLTVRRLSPRMGHRLLLDAFARVARDHEQARLFVAGDGPLRPELEARAAELGIDDRVEFLGYVPDDELAAVFASADVFVLPTRRLEGFGLATLEALASGTPVVATPVGATPELLGPLGEDGRLPGPGLARSPTRDALAEAMAAWAKLDASQWAKAGEVCRRYAVENYRWEQTTDAIEAAYERLLEG